MTASAGTVTAAGPVFPNAVNSGCTAAPLVSGLPICHHAASPHAPARPLRMFSALAVTVR